jgi:hypothetical protein
MSTVIQEILTSPFYSCQFHERVCAKSISNASIKTHRLVECSQQILFLGSRNTPAFVISSLLFSFIIIVENGSFLLFLIKVRIYGNHACHQIAIPLIFAHTLLIDCAGESQWRRSINKKEDENFVQEQSWHMKILCSHKNIVPFREYPSKKQNSFNYYIAHLRI